MPAIKIFLRNLSVLNILLGSAAISLTSFVILPFFSSKIGITIPRPKEMAATSIESQKVSQLPAYTDFAIVSQQNLFHPERKIPPLKKDEKQLEKPDIVLYGTFITHNLEGALIENKKEAYSTPGRGKRQVFLKVGGNVSGFILKKVETKRIILARGDEQMVVMLDDAKKKRTGDGISKDTTEQSRRAFTKQAVMPSSARPVPPQPAPSIRVQDLRKNIPAQNLEKK